VSFLNSVYPLVRIYHEIIVQSDGSSLLVRVAFEDVVVNVLLTQIRVPLMFVFLVILRQADVFAVSNLILPCVGLKIVKNVLAKLQVYVDWHLVRVTRVHLAQLVVYVKVLIREQSHIHNC